MTLTPLTRLADLPKTPLIEIHAASLDEALATWSKRHPEPPAAVWYKVVNDKMVRYFLGAES